MHWHVGLVFCCQLCSQVQAYSAHHRSLHPHIISTRETYLLTSHAESPLCAWDLRLVHESYLHDFCFGGLEQRPDAIAWYRTHMPPLPRNMNAPVY